MTGSATSPGEVSWTPRELTDSGIRRIATALSAVDQLDTSAGSAALLRAAVELARERLELERVSLFIREPSERGVLFHGTWGTGAHGETTDEHALFHELSLGDQEALMRARSAGLFGTYQPRAALTASALGRTFVIAEGWIMATPLVAAGKLVGVMYNDSALTHQPIDKEKQGAAAVFCELIASLLFVKGRHAAGPAWPLTTTHSALVRRVLGALDVDLSLSGGQLARDLGVSAGHLARSFKREMAMSLVDYRNRLRMDRFFEAVYGNADCRTLHDAAIEAGFGSYAQFHRTYRKFHGAPPRATLDVAREDAMRAAALAGAPRRGPAPSPARPDSGRSRRAPTS
jgi:AraC-like DNA-binding protein